MLNLNYGHKASYCMNRAWGQELSSVVFRLANQSGVVGLANKAKHIVPLRFQNYHLSRNRPSFEYCLIHPGASSRPGKSREWFPLGRGVLGRMDRRGVYGATWHGGDSNSCPCLYPETKRQSALLGVCLVEIFEL